MSSNPNCILQDTVAKLNGKVLKRARWSLFSFPCPSAIPYMYAFSMLEEIQGQPDLEELPAHKEPPECQGRGRCCQREIGRRCVQSGQGEAASALWSHRDSLEKDGIAARPLKARWDGWGDVPLLGTA